MAEKYEWPPEVPTTGTVIKEMDAAFRRSVSTVRVDREIVRGWMWCLIEVAALLDPDNPPLTREQLAQLRPARQRGKP